jgi:hypothetical protein
MKRIPTEPGELLQSAASITKGETQAKTIFNKLSRDKDTLKSKLASGASVQKREQLEGINTAKEDADHDRLQEKLLHDLDVTDTKLELPDSE